MRTGKAIGLEEKKNFIRHALRNALLPIVTMAGLMVKLGVTGALLTEITFTWPGLGTVLYIALRRRDYPVVMGMFIFTSILVVFGTLCIDILYSVLDPRVVYE